MILGIYEIIILWAACGVLARIIFWRMNGMEDDITQGQLIWAILFGLPALTIVIFYWLDSTRVIFKGKSK